MRDAFAAGFNPRNQDMFENSLLRDGVVSGNCGLIEPRISVDINRMRPILEICKRLRALPPRRKPSMERLV